MLGSEDTSEDRVRKALTDCSNGTYVDLSLLFNESAISQKKFFQILSEIFDDASGGEVDDKQLHNIIDFIIKSPATPHEAKSDQFKALNSILGFALTYVFGDIGREDLTEFVCEALVDCAAETRTSVFGCLGALADANFFAIGPKMKFIIERCLVAIEEDNTEVVSEVEYFFSRIVDNTITLIDDGSSFDGMGILALFPSAGQRGRQQLLKLLLMALTKTPPGKRSFNTPGLDQIVDIIQLHDISDEPNSKCVKNITIGDVRFLTVKQLGKVLETLMISENFIADIIKAMVEFENGSEDNLDSIIVDCTVIKHWNRLDEFHRELMQGFLLKTLCFSKRENRDTSSHLLTALASARENLWPKLPNSLVELIQNVHDSPTLITVMHTMNKLFQRVHDFTSSKDASKLYEAIIPLMNRQGDIPLQHAVLACIKTFVQKHPYTSSLFHFICDVEIELRKVAVEDQELKATVDDCKYTMHAEFLKLL